MRCAVRQAHAALGMRLVKNCRKLDRLRDAERSVRFILRCGDTADQPLFPCKLYTVIVPARLGNITERERIRRNPAGWSRWVDSNCQRQPIQRANWP